MSRTFALRTMAYDRKAIEKRHHVENRSAELLGRNEAHAFLSPPVNRRLRPFANPPKREERHE